MGFLPALIAIILSLCWGLLAADLQAVSIPASDIWAGNDGSWSTFALRVGTPAQDVLVLVSNVGSETFVVLPQGCTSSDPSTCPSDRGNTFDIDNSTTWDNYDIYDLGLDTNLGFNGPYDNGQYGQDTVGLGWQGSGGPTLNNQTVAGYDTKDFFLGIFGLSPSPTNLSTFDQGIPTFFYTLNETGVIPSLTWSYTAGAPYRFKGVLGSLVFGGYDTSRFAPINTTFSFGSDNDHPFVAGIQSITYTDSNTTNGNLLAPGEGIYALIDSTVPHLWLPDSVCQQFEEAFGLTWNETAEYYFLNETQHDALTAQNATITITLANIVSTTTDGGPPSETIDFVLPYAAFDLEASYPIVENTTYYFPLKRAANDSQYTLGRVFLQEAYLIADYERQNFSISPCIWNANAVENLVTIQPLSSDDTSSHSDHKSSPAGGTIAGIAVSTISGLVLCISIIWFFFIRPRRRDSYKASRGPSPVEVPVTVASRMAHHGEPIAELDGITITELAGESKPQELVDDTPLSARLPPYIHEKNGFSLSPGTIYEDANDVIHELPGDFAPIIGAIARADSRMSAGTRTNSTASSSRYRPSLRRDSSISGVSSMTSDSGESGVVSSLGRPSPPAEDDCDVGMPISKKANDIPDPMSSEASGSEGNVPDNDRDHTLAEKSDQDDSQEAPIVSQSPALETRGIGGELGDGNASNMVDTDGEMEEERDQSNSKDSSE